MNMMASVPAEAEEAARETPANPLLARFEALQSAADSLRLLTGAPRGTRPDPAQLTLRPTAGGTSGPQAAMADLCDMMEQGLFAVLRAREQGAEGHVAARTLLKRFDREYRRIFAERPRESEADPKEAV